MKRVLGNNENKVITITDEIFTSSLVLMGLTHEFIISAKTTTTTTTTTTTSHSNQNRFSNVLT